MIQRPESNLEGSLHHKFHHKIQTKQLNALASVYSYTMLTFVYL